MKRYLPALLLLSACAPATTSLPVPHLTVSGLTVTVHNPAKVPLTGDVSRGQGPAITVDGIGITPAPGASCVAGKREGGVRWACSVPSVAPGGKDTLSFVGGAGASISDANGFGYLGNAIMVPIVKLP